MAAELVLGPVFGLLIFGWAIFFASLAMYRRQVAEERFARLRARWEGLFRTPQGHRLQVQWHEGEGWVAALLDAPPGSQAGHFRGALRGDTMTLTLGASGVALDLRFLEEDLLVSPLVPGLHGDTSVEMEWLAHLMSAGAPRWQRTA